MNFREQVIDLLHMETKLDKVEIDKIITIPPTKSLGDFSFPAFSLAKAYKKSPVEIAKEIATKIKPLRDIKEIKSEGPYVNFYVDQNAFTKSIINQDYTPKSELIPKKVLFEFPSPNTNKPLHLGHVRNIVLGQSCSRLFGYCGADVHIANLINNRGIHICKSMVAYKKWGENKKPNKKSDKFLGDFYVMFSKKLEEHPELEEVARQMLRDWELEKKDVVKLAEKMNKWAYEGHDQTYKTFNLEFAKTYYELDIYKFGKEIVEEAIKKKILFVDKKDNCTVADLEKYGIPNTVILRSDGTALYMVQDLYLADNKYKDFKADLSVIVVANEQINHFKQLFKILELLGRPYKLHHLSYGMVNLPEGRMKSREGTVVDADDLVDELITMAKAEILERHRDISLEEVETRAKKIAMGALRFFLLKQDTVKDLTYDPKQSLSFEGETGPYVQYSHARICSILEKADELDFENVDYSKLTDNKEQEIISFLGNFKDVILQSALQYRPNSLCRYLLDLSQKFNEYYHAVQILKTEDHKTRNARLVLIDKIREIIDLGLNLLHIDAPEKM